MQQVLEVQSVDTLLPIQRRHSGVNKHRLHLLWIVEPVYAETTWQTSDTVEETLECFGKVMGDEILVDLDHGHPGLVLVSKKRFATKSGNQCVSCHMRNEGR
jgi:hypothetical protein